MPSTHPGNVRVYIPRETSQCVVKLLVRSLRFKRHYMEELEHVERSRRSGAGCRCREQAMPEELNRERLSSLARAEGKRNFVYSSYVKHHEIVVMGRLWR